MPYRSLVTICPVMATRPKVREDHIPLQEPGPAVLLGKDKLGQTTSYTGVIPHIKVLRGSLLTPIPGEKQIPRTDGKATHNYQTLYQDYTITLYCDEEDVAPLSDYDHLLLAGIQSLNYRYQTFITPNKLEWGGQLKVGDRVLVSIPDFIASLSGATRKTSAVIQYIGPLDGVPGLTFGVEIMDPHYYGQGTTDGTFQDVRYFICHDGDGLFVSLDKISKDRTCGSLADKPPAESQRTQQTDHESHLEQELRKEAKQLRDEMAAQSLEQQRLVEQLLKDQQQQTKQQEQLEREKQELKSKNQQLIHQLEQLQREQQQQKEELLRESGDHIQQLEQENQLRVQEVHHLQQQLRQEQERSRRLQERLDTSAVQPATRLLSSVQFNTVNRTEVHVQNNIGKGAWGEVARGKFKGQPVAVKWPHMDLLQQYPNIIDRMRREMRIMAQVCHPNLVRFIAAVLDEAAERLQAPPMIITELLDTNLRLAYQQGQLQTTDCVTILRDVAYALHYLHKHLEPIIHRDISAPNILLQSLPSRGWLAKVSDFGSANLAKLAYTAGEGAIIYTAPEAFPHTDLDSEPPPMTTKIDVYSYGILVCEVITSRPPFTENFRGMLQEAKAKWVFMYNLIVRCTKRSPQDRPTMAQVLDELNTLPHPSPRTLP